MTAKRLGMMCAAVLLTAALSAGSLMQVKAAGTGSKSPDRGKGQTTASDESGEEAEAEKDKADAEKDAADAEIPEGMVISELTGEPIDEALQHQRPIAMMVDNEKTALPHFGIAEADVVYEMMNSTANGRITRLMVLLKDWSDIVQMGNIRSARPTNILLASEWNAVLCHDGGPYYNNQYFSRKWADHFSATFSRVRNGKPSEFTEYALAGDMEKNFARTGYSVEYNEYAPEGAEESHFRFVPYGSSVDLKEKYETVYDAQYVSLPFKHNKSQLAFNEETGTYDYYEYDTLHEDAEDKEVLTFTNVLLQCCDFKQLDQNGYMIYDVISSGLGLYIHNGVAIDCAWVKNSETDITRFYDINGEELEINTGKTYIGLIPADSWEQVRLE